MIILMVKVEVITLNVASRLYATEDLYGDDVRKSAIREAELMFAEGITL